MHFADRSDAGRRLAFDLARQDYRQPVVVALPRGGVPVGAEVAARLGVPFDVLVVRTLGYPRQPDLKIGAVAEGDVRIIDEDAVSPLDLAAPQLEGLVADELAEVRRRVRCYRADRPAIPLEGRTAIVVDDGLRTGAIASAAINVLRRRSPSAVVLAVPVGPAATVEWLRRSADDVRCLHAAHAFTSIRSWYTDFAPVSDTDVAALLTNRVSIDASDHHG